MARNGKQYVAHLVGNRVSQDPWQRHAMLRRVCRDTLYVDIREIRTPYGHTQNLSVSNEPICAVSLDERDANDAAACWLISFRPRDECDARRLENPRGLSQRVVQVADEKGIQDLNHDNGPIVACR